MESNENTIRLTGSASISEPLKLGQDYEVKAVANVFKVEAVDGQDGTFDKIHKLKLITAEVSENGRTITTKVKGSQSKLFRWKVIEEAQEQKPDINEDEAYNKVMAYLLDHVEDIVKRVI